MLIKFVRKAPFVIAKRKFWTWLDTNYSKHEGERLKKLGPDRACAEWLLKHGASVRWMGNENFVTDLNHLPPEGSAHFIKEIDATDSSIAQHGFPVMKFCTRLERLILHGCKFLPNDALKYLVSFYPPNLVYLQISNCRQITDEGLLSLRSVPHLQRLVLYDLPFVKDKKAVMLTLKEALKDCEVTYIYANDVH